MSDDFPVKSVSSLRPTPGEFLKIAAFLLVIAD